MLNRPLLTAVYTLTLLFGLGSLFFPVPSIEGVFGVINTAIYAVLLIIGALGCLYGVIKPNYKVEYVFLWFVTGGYLLYDLALWALYIERLTSGITEVPAAYGPPLVVLVLSLFLCAKILLLDKLNKHQISLAENTAPVKVPNANRLD